jgi:tRNA threonylcarbamoyladenosine biosynthesis protein TsaB
VAGSGDSAALAVAFETSTRSPSIAVRFGEQLRELRLEGDRPHASDLLPALDRLLTECGARPSAIDALIVGLGPGSYTGLRVGVATALGLGYGTGARLRGVASVEVLAWQELKPGEQAAVLLDARQGQLYFARYERTADEIVTLHAPCVTTPAELGALLPEGTAIFGEPGIAEAAHLTAGQRAHLRIDATPSARALLELGLARLARLGPHSPAELEPLYLRAFAAQARRR